MTNSNLFWDIFIAVSFIIEWFVCKKILDYTSEPKFYEYKINICMLIIIVFANVLYFFNILPDVRVIISVTITVIFYKVLYKVKFTKAVLISLMYWLLLIGIDALSMTLTIWMNSIDDMSRLLTENIYRIESVSLGKIILLSVLFIYKSFKQKLDVEINKRTLIFTIIPISANIVSFFVIFKYVFNPSRRILIHSYEILVVSAVLFLSNISLILITIKLQKDSKLILENNMIKKIGEMQNLYYEKMEKKYIKTRLLSHDMKNHILCIKAMLDRNLDVSLYLNNLQLEIQDNNITFDTGNIILDAILSDKKELCTKKGIEFNTNINFSHCDFIDSVDICHIFSNILDNAIEACSKIEMGTKEITLKGDVKNSFYFMRVENTKINNIIVKNNNFITDKEDRFQHGLGIKSIKNAVNKYDGTVVIEYDDKKFIVKITIPIKNANKVDYVV
ncbi:GHKL domain-containing protein [Clostridioides sp. ZZV14-6154]|uniref:GHKL domain-containing protein n=1 Tax=Clostridioides sp. ZZV14-6154 TaxID=2811495 RepID=UPI001D12871F|nr:GHKL domain-containing protein [Clostridioides sp. ZZV14-6154]